MRSYILVSLAASVLAVPAHMELEITIPKGVHSSTPLTTSDDGFCIPFHGHRCDIGNGNNFDCCPPFTCMPFNDPDGPSTCRVKDVNVAKTKSTPPVKAKDDDDDDICMPPYYATHQLCGVDEPEFKCCDDEFVCKSIRQTNLYGCQPKDLPAVKKTTTTTKDQEKTTNDDDDSCAPPYADCAYGDEKIACCGPFKCTQPEGSFIGKCEYDPDHQGAAKKTFKHTLSKGLLQL